MKEITWDKSMRNPVVYKGKGQVFKVLNENNITFLVVFDNKFFILGINNIDEENKSLNVWEVKQYHKYQTVLIGYYNKLVLYYDAINQQYFVNGNDKMLIKLGQYEYGEGYQHAYIIEHPEHF